MKIISNIKYYKKEVEFLIVANIYFQKLLQCGYFFVIIPVIRKTVTHLIIVFRSKTAP